MSKSLEILEKLIEFRTTSTAPKTEFDSCWNYINEHMAKLEDWEYRQYESNGHICRVYCHKKYIKENLKNFDIYLYGNIDVVEGSDDLFKAKIQKDILIGRGVCDMKFGVAVAIETLSTLPKEYLNKKIALIITSDEELGGVDGAKYLVDKQKYRGKVIIGPNGMLNKEKFYFEISNKGTIHTKYITKGKSSHGSRPWLGINAIEKLINFYTELKTEFDRGNAEIWDSTINLGTLNGGFATNAVPDQAIMQIDFRYIDQNQADWYYKKEKELMSKHKISKKLIVDAINIKTDLESKEFKLFESIVKQFIKPEYIDYYKSYGSHDVREFFKVGMLPIIFTPRGGGNHTEMEWIKISDLEKLVQINKKFIESYYE